MNLIWHIAWNDLRRLQGLVVLWTALLAAKIGLGVMLIRGIGGKFDPLFFGSNGLSALEVVTAYVLTAAVVHGDVLVGSASFWMTRPISHQRLFMGKLVGLALIFGVIPLAITFPWWLTCGYGVREVLLASIETLLWQGMIVSVALPLATLTDGLGRFLFWTLILVATAIFAMASTPINSRGAALPMLSVFVISGLVGAALHVLKRRLLIGGTLFGVTAAAAAVVIVFYFSTRSLPQSAPFLPSPHAEEVELSFLEAQSRPKGSSAVVTVELRARGVPPELVLQGTATNRWSWSDGAALERWVSLEGAEPGRWLDWMMTMMIRRSLQEGPKFMGETQAFHRALGLQTSSPGPQVLIGMQTDLPAAFAERARREPPSFLVQARIQLMRPVVVGESYALESEMIRGRRERTRIIQSIYGFLSEGNPPSVRSSSPKPGSSFERVFLRLSEYRPTMLDGEERTAGFGPFLFFSWPKRIHLVINRERGGATAPAFSRMYDTPRSKAVRIGTVGIVWRTVEATPPWEYSTTTGRWFHQGANWFDHISVAEFELREEERFTKELHVERFELTPNLSNRISP